MGHCCSYTGNYPLCLLLLDAGAGVDTREWLGHTSLYLACVVGNEKVARLLVDRGAQPSLLSPDCVNSARSGGHNHIVSFLASIMDVKVLCREGDAGWGVTGGADWTCSSCTFANATTRDRCEMCNTWNPTTRFPNRETSPGTEAVTRSGEEVEAGETEGREGGLKRGMCGAGAVPRAGGQPIPRPGEDQEGHNAEGKCPCCVLS